MQRRHVIAVGAAVLALVFGAVALAGEEDDAAVEAALKWLAIVDAGDYANSWTEAAEYFRKAVTRDRWVETMEAVRRPLGDRVSRELRSVEFTSTLPGAPDGEYAVIQFTTELENKASTVESVIPMMDPDGAWRVAGYFIN